MDEKHLKKEIFEQTVTVIYTFWRYMPKYASFNRWAAGDRYSGDWTFPSTSNVNINLFNRLQGENNQSSSCVPLSLLSQIWNTCLKRLTKTRNERAYCTRIQWWQECRRQLYIGQNKLATWDRNVVLLNMAGRRIYTFLNENLLVRIIMTTNSGV